ncbi:MAG: hypothetical protein AAFW87_01250 [Pseudomonadota bacterium]
MSAGDTLPGDWRDQHERLAANAPPGVRRSFKDISAHGIPLGTARHFVKIVLANDEPRELFVGLHDWFDTFIARPGADPMLTKEAHDYPYQLFNDRHRFISWYALAHDLHDGSSLFLIDLGRIATELHAAYPGGVPDQALEDTLAGFDFVTT